MKGIEDRLRQDLTQFAQRAQPETIRPLRMPAPRRRARTARWLAPVAAAAAVVAVVACVTLVGHMSSRPATGAPAGMPAYYVVVVQTTSGSAEHPTSTGTANVYSSATGRLLDKVAVPSGPGLSGGSAITASANDRLFAITTGDGRIYLLRLTADGHSEGLQRLPAKDAMEGTIPALSPDGRYLAYLTQNCSDGCVFGVGVMRVAQPSAVKIWTQKNGASPEQVSWAGDSSQVMFGSQSDPQVQGLRYRLLTVTAPGGNLLAESRPIAFPATMSTGPVLLTSGGGTAVGATEQNNPSRHTVTGRIVELSRGTGRQRVLYVGTEHYTSKQGVPTGRQGSFCYVQSLAPAGVQPLVLCYQKFGRIVDGKFTPLPGKPGANTNRTTWDAAW